MLQCGDFDQGKIPWKRKGFSRFSFGSGLKLSVLSPSSLGQQKKKFHHRSSALSCMSYNDYFQSSLSTVSMYDLSENYWSFKCWNYPLTAFWHANFFITRWAFVSCVDCRLCWEAIWKLMNDWIDQREVLKFKPFLNNSKDAWNNSYNLDAWGESNVEKSYRTSTDISANKLLWFSSSDIYWEILFQYSDSNA